MGKATVVAACEEGKQMHRQLFKSLMDQICEHNAKYALLRGLVDDSGREGEISGREERS